MSKSEIFGTLTRKQLRTVITAVTGKRTKRWRKDRLVALAVKVRAKAPGVKVAAKKKAA